MVSQSNCNHPQPPLLPTFYCLLVLWNTQQGRWRLHLCLLLLYRWISLSLLVRAVKKIFNYLLCVTCDYVSVRLISELLSLNKIPVMKLSLQRFNTWTFFFEPSSGHCVYKQQTRGVFSQKYIQIMVAKQPDFQ